MSELQETIDRDRAYAYFLDNKTLVEDWERRMARIKANNTWASTQPKHLCPDRRDMTVPRGLIPTEDHYREDGTCSYCGSCSGADFLAEITKGVELGPTDKAYKVYLHGSKWMKFYFWHLDEAQQIEFVRLLNENKLKIGMPGGFYVMPFFVKKPSEAGAPFDPLAHIPRKASQ